MRLLRRVNLTHVGWSAGSHLDLGRAHSTAGVELRTAKVGFFDTGGPDGGAVVGSNDGQGEEYNEVPGYCIGRLHKQRIDSKVRFDTHKESR